MEYMEFIGAGFTLQTPTEWLITSSPEHQVIFLGANNPQGVRPNVMVAIRAVEDTVTVSKLAQETLAAQKAELPHYRVLSEMDNSERGVFERTYQWARPSDGASIIQTQRFYVLGNVLFSFTATRLELEVVYEPVFKHMLNSFRLVLTPTT
ncbi:MAG: hypothetical protein SFZ02_08100 [bacterium]|nr:hypothetical protein [bacterium]